MVKVYLKQRLNKDNQKSSISDMLQLARIGHTVSVPFLELVEAPSNCPIIAASQRLL